MKRLISLFAIALSIGWLTGCGQSDIAALVTTLGNTASGIASIEGDTSLATKLKTDTAAASAAVLAWKAGTPATEAVEALNLVEDDLNLFPVTGDATALIDLAIGTTEAIIEEVTANSQSLPASATGIAVAHVSAVRHVTLVKPPKTAKQFREQYAAIIRANPQLAKYAPAASGS